MKTSTDISIRNFFTRLLYREYWPSGLVYTPMYAVFLWYCLRSGFRFFFTAANPGIENGGMVMESKYGIYRQLPEGSYPHTLFFKAGTPASEVLQRVREAGLNFPLILKPDIGMKGLAVKKIDDAASLAYTATQFTVDFLIQSLSPYETELGIFWARLPGCDTGRITGIVGKELLAITGNGHSTMYQLLRQNRRYCLQLPALRRQYGTKLQQVLAVGEKRVLAPYGNHARGAKFVDVTHLASEKLNSFMNDFCGQIPGFYFGRLDIRCSSLEALANGHDFSIIELNGAGSEPTHIYDPRHSLLFAWREIARHWRLLWRISRANHKKGHAYISWKTGTALFRSNIRYTKKLEQLHRRLSQAGPQHAITTPVTAGRAVAAF